MNGEVKSDIETNFRRIEAIFDSNIFSGENLQNPLLQSALVELLIRLRDLMAKSRIHAERVTFDDDINKNVDINDVTDLIKFIRDAVCHVDSENHYMEDGEGSKKLRARLSFNIMFGQGTLGQINEIEFKSDYEDDVCFFFGSQKIYLNRHIKRAYEKAKENLLPIIENV